MLKLYFSPGACSMAAHIALAEAGLNFQAVRVDIKTKETADGPYLSINPKGYVPALKQETGAVMTEVVAILQWVADQVPQKGLVPAWSQPERYKAIEWLNFIATEIHKGIGPLFNPAIEPATRELAVSKVLKRYELLDSQLAMRPYMLGESFTIVDAYLFTITNWTVFHKIDMTPFPNINHFMERVRARPCVQQVLKAEGLIPA